LPGVRNLIGILLAAMCLALAACGGDDDETTGTAEGASGTTGAAEATTTTSAERDQDDNPGLISDFRTTPPKAVKVVLTTPHPELACQALVTAEFVERAYGGFDACKAAIEGGASADSVEVTDVERDGDTATAVAVPDGGPNSGEHIDVKLVREDGVWKVDDLHSNVPAGP
jgi:ABC-type glycerol-3-phosphate transport system substrate-binding protein